MSNIEDMHKGVRLTHGGPLTLRPQLHCNCAVLYLPKATLAPHGPVGALITHSSCVSFSE